MKKNNLRKFLFPNKLKVWKLRYKYCKKHYGFYGSIKRIRIIGFHNMVKEADKNATAEMVLALGIVGGILAVFYGVDSVIRNDLHDNQLKKRLDALERGIVHMH